MHGVVRSLGQAHQVPLGVRVLRPVLRGPDVVDHVGLDDAPVPRGLAAAVVIPPEDAQPKGAPAFVFAAVIETHGETKKREPGAFPIPLGSGMALALVLALRL